jgi:alpha-amylase
MSRHVLSTFVLSVFVISMAAPAHRAYAQEPVMMQGFYWDVTPNGVWYDTLATYAPALSRAGFTAIWFPPPSKGAAGGFDVGYTPYDYFDLGEFDSRGGDQTSGNGSFIATRYGTRVGLQRAIQAYRAGGMAVIADAVLNHRSGGNSEANVHASWFTDRNGGSLYSPDGVNTFTAFPLTHGSGRIAWPVGGGNEFFYPNSVRNPGNTGDFFADNQLTGFHNLYTNWFGYDNALHNGDGSNLPMGDSLIAWGQWLVDEIGFDGFRFDFVKGIHPEYLKRFMSSGSMAGKLHVHELYDGSMDRKVSYLNQIAGTPSKGLLFDFNLRFAYKELSDGGNDADIRILESRGLARRFGVDWEQIAPFVENHDFDRTNYQGQATQEGHSPIVNNKMLWYAHMLTHPGYPQVFWRDYFHYGMGDQIARLVQIRRNFSSGGLRILTRYDQGVTGPFYPGFQGNDERQVYVAQRLGSGGNTGLIVSLNKDTRYDIGVWVTAAGWENRRLYDITGMRSDTLEVEADGRVKITTNAASYSVWVPVEYTLDGGLSMSVSGMTLAGLAQPSAPVSAGSQVTPFLYFSNDGFLTARNAEVTLELIRDGVVTSLETRSVPTLRGAERTTLLMNGVTLPEVGRYQLRATVSVPGMAAHGGSQRTLEVVTVHAGAAYNPYTEARFGGDEAGNYPAWTTATGRGSGFGAWSYSLSPSGFRYLGRSHGSLIDSPNGTAFGLSSANGTYSATRPLSTPLQPGEYVQLDLSSNWRNGSRGVEVLTSGGGTPYVFSITNSGYGDTGWAWATGNDHIRLRARQVQSGSYVIELERVNNGDRWTSEPISGVVSGVRAFVSDAGNDNRAHFFVNNLRLLRSWQITFTGSEGWRMITVPVSGVRYADVLAPIWTQGVPGAKFEGGVPNVYTFDEPSGAFVAVPDLNAVMQPGTGVLVGVFADDNNDGNADAFPKILRFDGAEAGEVTGRSLGFTAAPAGGAGYHLMGNPFVTSLDVTQMGIEGNENMHANVYVWDPNAGSYRAVPAFGTASQWIAPFQSFFVKADAATQLSVPYRAKWSGGEFRGKQPGSEAVVADGDLVAEMPLRLVLTQGELADEFAVLSHPRSNLGADRYDAFQMGSLQADHVALYSVQRRTAAGEAGEQVSEADVSMASEVLPPDFTEGVELPLFARSTVEGGLELRVTSVGWLQGRATLEDLVSGEVWDVREGLVIELPEGADGLAKGVGDGNGSADGRDGRRIRPGLREQSGGGVADGSNGSVAKGFGDGIYDVAARMLKFDQNQPEASIPEVPRFILRLSPMEGLSTETGTDLPLQTSLRPNFPNPFNPETTIVYDIGTGVAGGAASQVRLTVYDVLGRQVAVLVNGVQAPGSYTVRFDATGLASGIYVYRLQAGSTVVSRKMLLVQ